MTESCGASLDDLVGEQLKRFRNRETECLGRLKIDNELKLRGLLDRQVGRRGPFEDLIHVGGAAALQISKARSIAHEATEFRKLPGLGDRGQSVLGGKIGDMFALGEKQRARKHDEGVSAIAGYREESAIEVPAPHLQHSITSSARARSFRADLFNTQRTLF